MKLQVPNNIFAQISHGGNIPKDKGGPFRPTKKHPFLRGAESGNGSEVEKIENFINY